MCITAISIASSQDVAKRMTESARKVAFDNGFFVIELGERASAENV